MFKWRPYEDSVYELPVTGVSRLQISKDRGLFAAGDVHWTVNIYATSDFRTICCLVSEDVWPSVQVLDASSISAELMEMPGNPMLS